MSYRIDKPYAYACAGGSATLDTFEVPINAKNITLQIFYTGLDASDSEIEILQGQTNNAFDYVKDPAGNRAKIALAHANSSATINIVDIVTNKIRITWAEGAVTAGTISRIIFQFN